MNMNVDLSDMRNNGTMNMNNNSNMNINNNIGQDKIDPIWAQQN